MSEKQKVPGINIRDLIEERNWMALAGLALIVVGVLYFVGDLFGLHFDLWNLFLLGAGGWTLYDTWKKYSASGRVWTVAIRNRVLIGTVLILIGLLSAFHLSMWSLFMLVIAGWLAYDTWQQYKANGHTLTEPIRNRFIGAGVIALIGLFGLINLGITWPLIFIVIGLVMLFRYIGKQGR